MLKPGSYAFRYAEPLPYMLLDSIGWQSTCSANYGNEGHARTDHGHVVFQYTLSGEGKIEIGGESSVLHAGKGFLVKIPSSHHYYYAGRQDQPWEFIWLNAKGEDAVRMWERILARKGPIVSLQAGSQTLERFWELYRAVSIDGISDSASLSQLLYGFMLSLLAPETSMAAGPVSPQPIRRAKDFMREHYARSLSLEEIAANCSISRSYLCRLFQQKEGITPLEFLRRRRVEAAVALLRSTNSSVQEIGRICGFDSPSYFGKVFREYLGLSPREYRIRRQDYPFDTIFLE
ncbi:AraC family transcriptional regulator [Paenibacillus nasutitermitis]|uniref:HTH araC/xylS-type domain-containing protein n=1 Tax=Paenibacillus nasutitermitis TaxID=1652958 RepID=A0A917DM21_9BACL|nr:AraC family transcriptional regulator [Paenibacillus nasutitermitis]GGD48452.1 hypothetical protein GCM10010911_02440 [Paenibacillus nasutitermitis]